jgi:hypothetical protein
MKGAGKATLAGVKEEMARSRVAKSVRKEHAHLHSSGRMTQGKKSANREEKENPRASQHWTSDPAELRKLHAAACPKLMIVSPLKIYAGTAEIC